MTDPILKTRTITSLVLVLVMLILLLLPPIGHYLLILLVGGGIVFEFSRMTRKKGAVPWIAMGLWFLTCLISYLFPTIIAVDIMVYSGVVIHSILLVTMFRKIKIRYERIMPIWAIFFPGIACAGLLAFIEYDHLYIYKPLLGLFMILWANDSGAYLVGRKWGKKKLIPHVSPNKTWAGFMGGGLFAFIASLVMAYFFDYQDLSFWVLIGVTVWLLGTSGDLYQSYFKRQYGVKDSGYFMPGHGGFWDRFDSFIFVLPYFLYILKSTI